MNVAGGTWQEAVKGFKISKGAFYTIIWRVVSAINHVHAGDMLAFKELHCPEELRAIEAEFNKLTKDVVKGCVGNKPSETLISVY